MSRSLLFLSYLFPPRGGAGVQRALKFAKHLPAFGWRPLVVTAGAAPARDGVTWQSDEALLADLPADAVVRRTTLTAGERRAFCRAQSKLGQRLAPTDPTGWWASPAVRAGLELAGEHDPSAILVTMSPFTSAAAGIALKRRLGLPLVLDLRDPWALDETRIYATRLHALLDRRAMERALSAADLVILNTPECEAAVRRELSPPPSARLATLTNGFDPEDYAGAEAVEPARPDVLRIVHTGMFHSELAQVWDDLAAGRSLASRLKVARRPINLWTRTPRYLLAAVERLVAGGELRREQVELVLAGEVTAADRAMVEASAVADRVRMPGYLSHPASVGQLLAADVLFLPLHTPLDGGPALIVPGKAYEYLGTGRPVLAMGPPGDMRRFVAEAPEGIALDGDDVAGAAEALLRLHRRKVAGDLPAPGVVATTASSSALARFDRRRLAGELAGLLDDLPVPAPAGSGRVRRAHLGMAT